jgi:hypothetical protein
MSNCIIFKCNNDHKNKYTIYFCKNNKFYLQTKGGYVEVKQALEEVAKYPVMMNRIPGMTEKIELMKQMAVMNYKEASEFYYDYQKSKAREGKLFEGDFNGK